MNRLNPRPFLPEDRDLLLQWRNDPETCRQSLNSRKITEEEHLAWFEAFLKSQNQGFIFEYGKKPVGMGRADHKEKGTIELSWSVAPNFRGQGFSKIIVLWLVQRFSDQYQCTAHIKGDNKASQAAAKSAGLSFVETVGGVELWKHHHKTLS